ncbi:hypothetical protein N7470_004795 [Penicillium chermesinum]|nr:hypothetical protein N7470_004795 [Penicillium chermesinum]
MLATRAAADPELKALMRVVASSQASQEQLRAFQAHIDELNAIIKAREQQEKRQQAATAAAAQQQKALHSQSATSAAQTKPPAQQAGTQPKEPETKTKTISQGQTSKSSEPSVQTPSKGPEQPKAVSSTPAAPPAKPPAEGTPQTTNASHVSDQAKSQDKTNAGSTPATEPNIKQEPAPLASGGATPAPSNAPATPASSQGAQQAPGVRPTPTPGNPPQPIPRPTPVYTPQQQQPYGAQTPIQSRPQPYATSSLYQAKPATPRVMYKAVVFEFTSPLTPYGSSTSGHAGSGDRYLFPEYSILEWLPSDNTLLASFLITRKVDPNTPFPIETAPEPTTARGKGKGASKSKKKGKAEEKNETPETPAPNQATTTPSTNPPATSESAEKSDTKQDGSGGPGEGAKKEANLKEYWQPVTFRIHAADSRILEPLTRVVKPPDEVRKYMNEIMDRAERAPDGYLALRLSREEAVEAIAAENTTASTPQTTTARHRSSRASVVKVEEEPEMEDTQVEEDLEEELKDFYGDPMGLPPLRV